MSSARIEAIAPGRWRISGQLTLSTVAALAAEGKRLAAGSRKPAAGSRKPAAGSRKPAAGGSTTTPATDADVQIDLADVEQGSSAGVALLLELQQEILHAGGRLDLRNVPESIERIAELSNVDSLLGIGPEQSDVSGQT